jgi:hypothetical protein
VGEKSIHDPWVKPVLATVRSSLRTWFLDTEFTFSLYYVGGIPGRYKPHSRIRIQYRVKDKTPKINDVFSVVQTAVKRVCFEKSFDLDAHLVSVRGKPGYILVE